MPNQSSGATPETIVEYEVLFTERTGITVLVPEVAAFDCGMEMPVSFKISPENPRDILIRAGDKEAMLRGLQKNHLDAAISHGFIMFYETKDNEVIRCTPCNYQKS
ncbi:MAG: hypothetical protein V1721_00995 [Pseudomonadota bacterium]